MENQLDIFGEPYGGHPPHVNTDTSIAAANAIAEDAGTIRAKVLICIQRAGARGRTDDEIEVALRMRHQTVSARRRELFLMGSIHETELRRATRSGRNAIVWVTK
jgi:hypothetical protein